MTILRKWISAAATITTVAAVFVLLALAATIAAGFKPQVVKSGSMRPMLDRGSVIFVKPTPVRELRVGEVITFQNPIKGGKELVTHRIVAIESQEEEGKRVFLTKGDANDYRDPWRAEIDAQAGVLAADLPFVGNISFLVHQRKGFIVLYVTPVALLAALTLWKIWRRPRTDVCTPDAAATELGCA